jgi:hypothetical protein
MAGASGPFPGRMERGEYLKLRLFLVPVYGLVAAFAYTLYLKLGGTSWAEAYAYVYARQLWFLVPGALLSFEPSDLQTKSRVVTDRPFEFRDLLPLVKVWNHNNKSYVNQCLWIGLLCGGAVGYGVARAQGWPRPAYYAWFWSLSVGTYMLVLGLQFCQRGHEEEMSTYIQPALKITYWLFFALIVDFALIVLNNLTGVTGEGSVVAIWQMQMNHASPLYQNVISAICLGILAAFPSKLFATYLIPHPLAHTLAHLDGLTKTVVEEVEDGALAMRIAEPSAVRRKRSGQKP